MERVIFPSAHPRVHNVDSLVSPNDVAFRIYRLRGNGKTPKSLICNYLPRADAIRFPMSGRILRSFLEKQFAPMSSTSFQQLANFIWSVADLLRGPYRPPQYERVMLPLTVLRRFDAVLAPTKDTVLKRHEQLSAKGIANIDAVLNNLAKDD